jgi:hypothetical protein
MIVSFIVFTFSIAAVFVFQRIEKIGGANSGLAERLKMRTQKVRSLYHIPHGESSM